MNANPYPHLSTTFAELTYRHHDGLETRDPQRNVFEIVAPEGKTVHLGLTHVFMAAPELLAALERIASVREPGEEVGALEQARVAIAKARGRLPR